MPRKYNRLPITVVIRSVSLVRGGTTFLLAAVVLAAIYALDPSDREWGLATLGSLKYVPTFLACAAVPFYLAGSRRVPLNDWPLLSLLAFSVLVLGGSLFTMLNRQVPAAETFLGRAFNVWPVLAGYMMMFFPREREFLVSRFAPILFGITVGMFLILGLWRLGIHVVLSKHIYHEEAVYFSAIAGAGLAAPGTRARVARVIVWSLAAALTVKITGFAFAAIALAGLVIVEFQGQRTEGAASRVMGKVSVVLVVLAGIFATLVTASVYRVLLPSGSPAVRLHTYAERWDLFTSSPLTGQWFVGTPIMQAGALTLPSHSDALDILAFGGILAGLLFLGPIAIALRHGLANLRSFVDSRSRLQTGCVVLVAAFLFELCFNPVLNQAKLSLPFWLGLGVVLADRRIRNGLSGSSRSSAAALRSRVR